MARQQKSYFSNDKLVKDIETFRSALGAPALSNFFKVQMDLANIGPEPVDSFPVDLDAASSGVYQKEKMANDLSRWLTSCGLLDNGEKERYEILCKLCNLNYHRFIADSVNVKKYDELSKKYIHEKILKESNYYKNMILKVSEIDKIIKTIQQPTDA